ncbi:MAG: prolyl oligopeptidase family serine peptidase [Pyrinomonadaceae bacterium]
MKKLLFIFVFFICLKSSFAQTADVSPGDNLIAQGIPKIPASLVEEVSRYTKGRNAGILCWHPVKREMLIATRFGNTAQVHKIEFPGAARTQLTFFDDNVTTGVSFQPKRGEYFIFSKDSSGDQNYQIHRYDLTTSKITLLTDGKSKNGSGVWSNKGDRIAYTSTKRNGKDVDLYLMNPADAASDKMLARLEGGGWSVADWSLDDRRILAVENVSANESYLWLFDLETGEKTLLTPKNQTGKSFYSAGEFSSDGRGIYVATDLDSEFRRLVYFDLTTKRQTVLTADINWDVEELKLSPDGKSVAAVTNEDGALTLHLFNTVTRRERLLPRSFPKGFVTGIRWRENENVLGFNLDSARFPTDAYSLDVKSGRVERWTQSETGGINTANFVEPELIRWKSFDGRMISGFLYRPPARFVGKRPVIIDIHGGPEAQFQPYYLGRRNYYLNELGIALVFPNIRGSSGYGKSFLKLDDGFLRENAYKDIGSLLDWTAAKPELDAERIMVTGVSYGGHLTLAAAVRYGDRIRCAVDIVGPSNLVTFLENTAGYRQDLRRVEYGDERDSKTRVFLESIAPLNNATKISKPLFVVQGKNDPIVPISEAEQMVAAVRKNGVSVWYLTAKDEGHGFLKKSNADFQFYATVLFIKRYLLT